MSGVLGRTPAPATAGAPPASTGSARSAAAVARDSLSMRLIAFAALGAFAAAHWGLLVEDPPVGRTLLVMLVATGGAAALGLLRRAPLPRPALHALAAAIGLAMLALGLMAAGLPGRLLLPAHWSELADGLDRGLAGMQEVDWPYDGPDTWIRRSILLGVPALLTVAAMLAFWPARRWAGGLRIAGLVTLLILYGTPVTENDPGAPALRGLVLLLLVGAWLWLPRMPPREAAIGAAVVASVGVLSLPVACRARRRARVVGLRGMEPVRQGRGDHVRLEPRVRPARLVAGRGHGAEREVGPTPLLEGRGTRLLRRAALGALRGGGRQPLRPRGAVLGVESRRPLELQRVQPELGRAHPLHGPLAVQHHGRGRGRHAPSGRRGRRPAELRRNHPAATRRDAREGRLVLRPHVGPESHQGADGGRAGRLLAGA